MGFVDKWIESLDYELEVLSSACLHSKSRRSTCDECLNVCSNDAITFRQGKPVIDHEKCGECGTCMTACPVQAISGILPKQSFFQNKLVTMIGCPPSIKELLIFYAKGVTTIVCESEKLSLLWEERVEETNSILAKLGRTPFQIETETDIVESYSRRDLFSLWKREGKSLIKQVTPAKWRFNHIDLELARYYPEDQFFDVTVKSDQCTLCNACEMLCPKECIKLTDSGMTISQQSCSGCKLCMEVCPEQAITVKHLIGPAVTKSYPAFTKTCPTCKNSFQTLHELDQECPDCINQKNGFLPSQA